MTHPIKRFRLGAPEINSPPSIPHRVASCASWATRSAHAVFDGDLGDPHAAHPELVADVLVGGGTVDDQGFYVCNIKSCGNNSGKTWSLAHAVHDHQGSR